MQFTVERLAKMILAPLNTLVLGNRRRSSMVSIPIYNFGKPTLVRNLFHNRKRDCLQSLNSWKPYDFCRSVLLVGVLAAVFSRRSKSDRRSLSDRLSPCIRLFSSGRVSTPRRRSLPARLSKLDRLLSSAMDVPPIAIFYGYNSLTGCKPQSSVFRRASTAAGGSRMGSPKPLNLFWMDQLDPPSIGAKRKGSGDDRSLSCSQA